LLYAENQHRTAGQSYRDHGHADESASK
jgi:hypothetical protein